MNCTDIMFSRRINTENVHLYEVPELIFGNDKQKYG